MERHGVKTASGVIRYFVGSLLLISTLLSCGGSRLRVAYGNYKYAQGEYGQATISYIRALKSAEASPARARDRSVLYYNLGNVYHALGETISATNTLSRAVSAGDWEELESRANYNLGNIYAEKGHLTESIEHYNEALRINPDYTEALNTLGNVLEYQGKLDEAVAHYLKALNIKPDNPVLHRNLAGALQKLGKTEEAEAHFREAKSLAQKTTQPDADENTSGK